MQSVRNTMIRLLASIDPWATDELDRRAAGLGEALAWVPVPDRDWPGPMGDPWLDSCADVDLLLMCDLAALSENLAGDDLIDDEIRAVIRAAASSEHELLRRPAAPLEERLEL